MKKNYFYVDEAGGIKDKSNFFILGCYKTDTPEVNRQAIEKLQYEILNKPYFAFGRKKFLKHGFHATDNHPDIWSQYYNVLATLNIRAYVLILKKDSNYFKKMISEGLNTTQIYNTCIKKLLSDRLTKTRNESNTLIFEQYGSKPKNWLTNLEAVLSETIDNINSRFGSDVSYNVELHDKSDLNLSIIDYINFLFIQLFEQSNMIRRMQENFKILEPKIGLIYKMDKDLYFDKTKRININEY